MARSSEKEATKEAREEAESNVNKKFYVAQAILVVSTAEPPVEVKDLREQTLPT